MWEVLVRLPLGRLSMRKFIMLFATLLVVTFGYSLISSPSAYAADTSWQNGKILYEGNTYDGPATTNEDSLSGLPPNTTYYTYREAPDRGFIIYFSSGVDPPAATEATRAAARFSGSSITSLSSNSPITLTPVPTTGDEPSSCSVDGIGWIVCPVSNWIAEGMDGLYNLLSEYLNTAPILGGDNSLYRMWEVVRNIANICFIIGFLILIYAQVTGGAMSNYTLKKILPRIIVSAILVNISYWICAIAVDLSNVTGASVQNLFMSMNENLGPADSEASNIGWAETATVALGGGSLALIGLAGATSFGGGALAFLLLGALFPALFAVFVAVTILAARQALITILIILAPLAFVAYLLPNTEEWFTRWRKLFTALMVMFPAFAVIFGGAQVAGVVIIQNANSVAVVILGLLVQVIPLFITPFLIRLSSGVMGTIAGMANDRSKGIFDRGKNWANENREMHKARAMRNGFNTGRGGQRFRPTTYGARMASGKMNRDKLTSAYQTQAEAGYSRTRRGQRAYNETQFGTDQKSAAEHANDEAWQRRVAGDLTSSRRTPLGRNREDRRYANHQEMLHESHRAHTSAGIIKDAIEQEGERHVREHIADAAAGTYEARLRGMQVRSTVDKGIAEQAKLAVETQGQQQLQETILAGNALRDRARGIKVSEGRANQAKALIEDDANARWEELTLTDRTIYSRQLERQGHSKQIKQAQDQWESILVEASAGRTDDYQSKFGPITSDVDASIKSIQQADENIAVEAQRKSNAEYVFKSNLTKRLKDDAALLERAAGIDQDYGRTKVVANLTSEASKLYMENVAAVESTFTNDGYQPEELIKVYQTGELRRDASGNPVKATEMHVHAAMRQLLSDKGNNTSIQKMTDYVADQGMNYDSTTDTYTDKSGAVLSEEEAESRRNLQQIFADALAKSGHSVTHVSGTDRSALETGTYTVGTQNAILRDIATGKIKADRVGKMDIDEMFRSLQVFRDNPAELARISSENRESYVEVIDDAMNDPIIGAKLETRHRRALNAMKLYLDPATPAPDPTVADAVAGKPIPRNWDPLTLAD